MEQDSKDSAQSSATSTSTTDTVSQPEYKVPGHHINTNSQSNYPVMSRSSLCSCKNNPQVPIFVHLPSICNSSLKERLHLNVKIIAFVLVVYPLLCVSLSQAAARLESTDETMKVLNGVLWVIASSNSLLTTDS